MELVCSAGEWSPVSNASSVILVTLIYPLGQFLYNCILSPLFFFAGQYSNTGILPKWSLFPCCIALLFSQQSYNLHIVHLLFPQNCITAFYILWSIPLESSKNLLQLCAISMHYYLELHSYEWWKTYDALGTNALKSIYKNTKKKNQEDKLFHSWLVQSP